MTFLRHVARFSFLLDCVPSFLFIEHSELSRLIYITKMQWYNILARILLMLSVIDFALAAPVVVREHDSMADNGIAVSPLRPDPSWSANAVDQINAPPIPRSSDLGDWWEQEPGYHNPRSRTDSIGSPEPSNPANNPPSLSPPAGPGSTPPLPTSQAPTDETDPLKLNPSSPHGNADLNLSLYQGQGPTDNSYR